MGEVELQGTTRRKFIFIINGLLLATNKLTNAYLIGIPINDL